MTDGLFKYMKVFEAEALRHNVSTTLEGFTICVAHSLKGSCEEKAQLVAFLSGGELNAEPKFGNILQVYHLICFMNTIFMCQHNRVE